MLLFFFSLLFWTDYGSAPKIESSDLLGRNRKTIIASSIFKPVAIDIDITKNIIYWVDETFWTIEYCNLDGSNRNVLIQDNFVSTVSGISLFLVKYTLLY